MKSLKCRYSHNTISMWWDNTAYCVKLGGEDLSRYSNKIESLGFRKCAYWHCMFLTKWCHNNKHFAELHKFASHHRETTGGVSYIKHEEITSMSPYVVAVMNKWSK